MALVWQNVDVADVYKILRWKLPCVITEHSATLTVVNRSMSPLFADRNQVRKAGRTDLALYSCGHQFCSSVPMTVALSLEIQVDPSLDKDASTQIPTAQSQKETEDFVFTKQERESQRLPVANLAGTAEKCPCHA